MRVSALIVNFNSGSYSVNCIRALRAEADRSGLELEPVVVDNASPRAQRPFRAEAERLGARWVDHGWNAGYAAGVNRALRESTGEALLIVNPDVQFLEGSRAPLGAAARREGVGAAGPNTWWDIHRQIRFPPNVVPSLADLAAQSLAFLWGFWNRRYAYRRTRAALKIWLAEGEVEAPVLSGGCMVVRRDVFLRGGDLDERFPLYFEDTDWFVRARAMGYRLLQLQDAHVAHFFNRSGVTASEAAMARYWLSRRRYFRKHHGIAGEAVARFSQRLALGFHARRKRKAPMDRILDLGRHATPPTLALPRPCSRFLLELAQDPLFFLAGAIFGSGGSWTPAPECWGIFGSSGYYLRGFDLSGRRPRYLGTWYFERV